MRAHDVRRLRACDVCCALVDKDCAIVGYGAPLCGVCAVRRAGDISKFMATYPISEWKKLTLGVVGVSGMRKLLIAIREATAP